jgi:hypothetical protein
VDPLLTPSDSAGDILFRLLALATIGVSSQAYDVTRDGQRFLVKRAAKISLIHVVSNWNARLDR